MGGSNSRPCSGRRSRSLRSKLPEAAPAMAAEPAKLTPEVLAAVERLRQDGNFAFRRGKHAAAIEARATVTGAPTELAVLA